MKPKQAWTIGAFVLMIGMAATSILMGVLPMLGQIQALEENRESTRQANVARLAVLDELKIQSEDKAALMAALETKRELIPNRLGIVEFLDELKVISERRNLTVEKLSTTLPQVFVPPAAIRTNPSYGQAVANLDKNRLYVSNVTFSYRGTMGDINSAIFDLANGERYILITRISVPEAKGLGEAVVTADFTAQIFSLKAVQ